MFTCAKIYGGVRYLKHHLSANDYYSEGEKVVGDWIGQGSDLLGLSGEVHDEDFEALRLNVRPDTHERLTPRTKGTRIPTMTEAADEFWRMHQREGSSQEFANLRLAMKPLPNRVAFFDFQCSAQKSVSIMAVVAGDERLRVAHELAAQVGFAELEQFACRQKNTAVHRDNVMTGNLCGAAFLHDASRSLDPQLHTHFVIANATRDASGRWYALNERHLFKAVRYAGKVYQNELARQVKELGYNLREVRSAKGEITGFEIEGVSNDLCERFAKRREKIEWEIKAFKAKRGREPTRAEITQISRESRDPKLTEISTPEVRSRQRAQLLPGEWERLQTLHMHARFNASQTANIAGHEIESLQASVNHLFERQSVATAHQILAEALNQHLGTIELTTLKRVLAEGGAGLVPLTSEQALLAECTTQRGLELERWSVTFVNATKDRQPPLNPDFEPDGGLSSEQRTAVRTILSMRDQVFSFRGVAGSGKTTTLKEVQRGLHSRRVYTIAPTASAARVLQVEGFHNATTVEDFLQNVAKHEVIKGAVVICDEAGLKSNRQGAELLHLAQKHNLRVLLVGDTRQHVSVEAGDFLRVLETHSQLGRCEVTEIRRQQHAPGYKSAIIRMAVGDAKGGLSVLDTLGWLKEGHADYLHDAAEDYLRLTDGGKVLDRCLMVTPTWEENHGLTDYIRTGLKTRGHLANECTPFTVYDTLRWTHQQKGRAGNYAIGQIVAFTCAVGDLRSGDQAEVRRVEKDTVFISAPNGAEQTLDLRAAKAFDVGRARAIEVSPGEKLLIRANDKRQGLINGHVLTVDRIDPDQSIVTREGIRIPASFKQWCHGYVVTSHKSQGRTCEHVIVAAENLDAKAAYVACSRGKRSCTVHTPDKQRLLERLPEGNRRAAFDVLAESQPLEALSVRRRAEMRTRLFGKMIRQKATRARDALRRRLEQTRQIVLRWTRLQKIRRQCQSQAQQVQCTVRLGRAPTQPL